MYVCSFSVLVVLLCVVCFLCFNVFLCRPTDFLSSCLIFVSSVWASLPEIKRWYGMVWYGIPVHQKTRFPRLSYGVASVILGLAIFVELRLVTDGRTDILCGCTRKHSNKEKWGMAFCGKNLSY